MAHQISLWLSVCLMWATMCCGQERESATGLGLENHRRRTTPGFDSTAARLLRELPPPQALLLRAQLTAWVDERARANDVDVRPLSATDLLSSIRGQFPYAAIPYAPLSGNSIVVSRFRRRGSTRATAGDSGSATTTSGAFLTPAAVWSWREQVRGMHQHAWRSYVRHAYPADELRPLSCDGRWWDKRERGNLDDNLGGYALTLIDSLDQLAVTGDLAGFRAAASAAVLTVRMDAPVTTSVFEATIRVIGGLVSAHQLAESKRWGIFDARKHCGPAVGWPVRGAAWKRAHPASAPDIEEEADREAFHGYLANNASARDVCGRLMCGCGGTEENGGATDRTSDGGTCHILLSKRDPSHGGATGFRREPQPGGGSSAASGCMLRYNGELLALALELGYRLLPAFDTPTGIPFHRTHLRTGEPDASGSRESCTAAGGTFLMEFGTLSRLSGDPVFEAAARRSVAALWRRRSPNTGLVGGTIDVIDGAWRAPHTGIGAGVDSFLEYLAKASILFDDEAHARAWGDAAGAVAHHLDFGHLHLEASLAEGRSQPKHPVLSSLQAFWPGLEVLSGSVNDASAHLAPLLSLWAKHGALPELYDVPGRAPIHFAKDAPLRPELGESVFHAYAATRDPALLAWAATLAGALHNASRVPCGFASVADVTSKRLDDRMDSYFFAETLKYAFLTFDHALRVWGAGPAAPPSSAGADGPVGDEPDGRSGDIDGAESDEVEGSEEAHASQAASIGEDDPSQWASMWRQQCGCDPSPGEANDGDDPDDCDGDSAFEAVHPGAIECSVAGCRNVSTDALGAGGDARSSFLVGPAGLVDASGRAIDVIGMAHPDSLQAQGDHAEASASSECDGSAGSVSCSVRSDACSPRSCRLPRLSGHAAARADAWCNLLCATPSSDDALSHPLAWVSSDDVRASQTVVDDLTDVLSAAESAVRTFLGRDDSASGAVEEAIAAAVTAIGSASTPPLQPLSLAALPLRHEAVVFTTEGHVLEVTRELQRPGGGYPLAWLGAVTATEGIGLIRGHAHDEGDVTSAPPRIAPAAWSPPKWDSLPVFRHVWTHGEGLPLDASRRVVVPRSLAPDFEAAEHALAVARQLASATPHPSLLLEAPSGAQSGEECAEGAESCFGGLLAPRLSTSSSAMCLVSRMRLTLAGALGMSEDDAEADGSDADVSDSIPSISSPSFALHAPYPPVGTRALFPSRVRPFDETYGSGVTAAVGNAAHQQHQARQAQSLGVNDAEGAIAGAVRKVVASALASMGGGNAPTAGLTGPGGEGLPAGNLLGAGIASAFARAHGAFSRASEALTHRARSMMPEGTAGTPGMRVQVELVPPGGALSRRPTRSHPPLPPHVVHAVQQSLISHALATGEMTHAHAVAVAAARRGAGEEDVGGVRHVSVAVPSWVLPSLNSRTPDVYGGVVLGPEITSQLARPVVTDNGSVSATSIHLLAVSNASGLGHLVSPPTEGGGDADGHAQQLQADEGYPDDSVGGQCSTEIPAHVGTGYAAAPSLFSRPSDATTASGFVTSVWTLSTGGVAANPAPFQPAAFGNALSIVPLLPALSASTVLQCDPSAGRCGLMNAPVERQPPLAVHLHYHHHQDHAAGTGDEADAPHVHHPLSCGLRGLRAVDPTNGAVVRQKLEHSAHRCMDGATGAMGAPGPRSQRLAWFRGQSRYDDVAAAMSHEALHHPHRAAQRETHTHDAGDNEAQPGPDGGTPRVVAQLDELTLLASPAAFGPSFSGIGLSDMTPALTLPLDGCLDQFQAPDTAQPSFGAPGYRALQLLTAAPATTPMVAIVLRGTCSFGAKARAAAAAGASALLVLDIDSPDAHATVSVPDPNWPHAAGTEGSATGPVESIVPVDVWSEIDSPLPPHDADQPDVSTGGSINPPQPNQGGPFSAAGFLMADDGNGAQIDIPAAMIGGAHARLLVEALALVQARQRSALPVRLHEFRAWRRSGFAVSSKPGNSPLAPSNAALRLCVYSPSDTASLRQAGEYVTAFGGEGAAASVSPSGPSLIDRAQLMDAAPFPPQLGLPRRVPAAPASEASSASLRSYLASDPWALGLLPHPSRSVLSVLQGVFSHSQRVNAAIALVAQREAQKAAQVEDDARLAAAAAADRAARLAAEEHAQRAAADEARRLADEMRAAQEQLRVATAAIEQSVSLEGSAADEPALG